MSDDKSDNKKLKIWACKIGEIADKVLPPGSDWPMRDAVQKAYRELTGEDNKFCFSGWGGELTEPERAVVENRLLAKGGDDEIAKLLVELDKDADTSDRAVRTLELIRDLRDERDRLREELARLR